jgi:hypothetical protein
LVAITPSVVALHTIRLVRIARVIRLVRSIRNVRGIRFFMRRFLWRLGYRRLWVVIIAVMHYMPRYGAW